MYFMIMKNISEVSNHNIERSFDLKGSTVDREVLKKFPNANLNEITLKDLDFINFEHQIYLDDNNKSK